MVRQPGAVWLVLAAIGIYHVLHVLWLAVVLTFGQRAGGYPLSPIALGGHALLVLGGVLFATRTARRHSSTASVLAMTVAVCTLLGISIAGTFVTTQTLSWFGLRAEFAPYLDDDGTFAWTNMVLSLLVVAVSLATGWRRMLVGCMIAQGLALLLNPGLLPSVVIAGLPQLLGGGLNPDWQPFFGVPLAYAGAALALGWRPGARRGVAVGLAFAFLTAAALAPSVVSGLSFLAILVGLPLVGWRLRRWAEGNGEPSQWGVAGASLLLLSGVATLSWPYLGLGDGGGDNFLPRAGQYMGWIGKTAPADPYGLAGKALVALRTSYPWLLGLAGVTWAVGAGKVLLSRRPSALHSRWLPWATSALAMGLFLQGPWLYFGTGLWAPFGIPVVRGMAPAIPLLLGEERLTEAVAFLCLSLGFALLGGVACLRRTAHWRKSLTLALVYLAAFSAVVLTLGTVAGTIQEMRLQAQPSLPGFQEQVRLRLALNLPLNAGVALLGWVVTVGWLRRIVHREGQWSLPSKRLVGSAFAAVGIISVAGALFWRLTAMPVAETYPADGATGVALNAPIIVRLSAGERNWAPGVSATYSGGERVAPEQNGGYPGTAYFVPAGGWRPNTPVEVRLVGPSSTRGFTFSFVTGDAPSSDVPSRPAVGPRAADGPPAGRN